MIEYFFRKYSGKVSKGVIQNIFQRLTKVNKVLPYDNDFEELMNSYINLEMLKVESQLTKIEIENTIKKLNKSQHSIINRGIINKRENGSLISYLSNLDDKQLLDLNSLVDIEKEFKFVTENKFWEDKEKKRKSSGSKSFTVGGSDYSLNQTL